MEKYAGIPKDKISSVIVFPKSWHDTDDGAVIWDKLIKAIKDYMRRKWPNATLAEESQGPTLLPDQEVSSMLMYWGWFFEAEFNINIHTWYSGDDHLLGINFETIPVEEEPNPLEQLEEGEDRPQVQYNPAIDRDIVRYLESQGFSELKANRGDFNPEASRISDIIENTIYYDLKGYKLVLPPKIYNKVRKRLDDPNNVIEGS